MISWQYNSQNFKLNDSNTIIPEGDHRVVINKVTVKTYSSGNEGFEITLDVSGHSGKLWHRIILDPMNPEKTDHHLGKFFESFGITNYNLNDYESWVGKDGAVRVKHECYNGSMLAKVLFCITRAYQDKLPAWLEPACAERAYQPPAPRQTFDKAPTMPNEYTPPAPPQRQMGFKGFESGYYF